MALKFNKKEGIKGEKKKAPLILSGGVFILVGGLMSYFLLVRPVYRLIRATDWVETPCRIISARVEEHASDDGHTYSIEVEYEYQFGGRLYTGDRYDFLGGSSSGREGKQKVVDRYRAMAQPVCYVNPENPSESVLVRKLSLRYGIGLFPLVLVAAGAGVVIKARRRQKADTAEWIPKTQTAAAFFGSADTDPAATGDSILLKPDAAPLGKLIGILLFCLFWNGSISVFVIQVIKSFQSGRPEWFLILFMIPFIVAGLLVICAVIYQFLAIFNPRYTLVLEPARMEPGRTGRLRWQVKGMSGRVRNLTVQLVGTEKATYRRGTDTKTDEHVFYSANLASTEDFMEITAGQTDFAVPAPTMHSFNAPNNKIIWSIRLKGDVQYWPDVNQNYPFTVYPHDPARVKS